MKYTILIAIALMSQNVMARGNKHTLSGLALLPTVKTCNTGGYYYYGRCDYRTDLGILYQYKLKKGLTLSAGFTNKKVVLVGLGISF